MFRFVVVQCLALVVPVAAANLAFRIGTRQRGHGPQPTDDEQIVSIEGAMLWLLALLIAFSLSVTQDRYERRRLLLVDEANAISTAYLRAELLPPPATARCRELLRAYVDTRLELVTGLDWVAVGRAEAHAHALHASLWELAASEGRERPTPTTALFVSAVGDLIDLDEKWLDGLETHMPNPILLLLVLVAAAASGIVGFRSASSGRWSALPLVILPLLVSAALNVIVDLDTPPIGIIRPGHAPLDRVLSSLQAAPHPP
jgi:hypothetical protein